MVRLLAALMIGTTAVWLSGCATFAPAPNTPVEPETLARPAPIINTTKDTLVQPTLLERYNDICKRSEDQAARIEDLEKTLAAEKAGRTAAENGLAAAREEIARLKTAASEMEKIAQRYDESQKNLKSLNDEVAALRHTLLETQLKNVKLEQAVVTMKIEAAKARRTQAMNALAAASTAQTTTPAAPQEVPAP